MALTDTAVRNAKPGQKPVKLADEKGLLLLINPNGTKYWRQKYRIGGKEKCGPCQILPKNLLLRHEHNEHLSPRHPEVLRG